MQTEEALEWLTGRITRSNLFELFFKLRDEVGISGDEAAASVYGLATTFMLGDCLRFASVLGELNGFEHVVRVNRANGVLLHAMFACAPQHPGEGLKGAAVDILGRISLNEAVDELARFFGPVKVTIGERVPGDYLTDEDRQVIKTLAGALPWTRGYARVEGVSVSDLPRLARRYKAEEPAAAPLP